MLAGSTIASTAKTEHFDPQMHKSVDRHRLLHCKDSSAAHLSSHCLCLSCRQHVGQRAQQHARALHVGHLPWQPGYEAVCERGVAREGCQPLPGLICRDVTCISQVQASATQGSKAASGTRRAGQQARQSKAAMPMAIQRVAGKVHVLLQIVGCALMQARKQSTAQSQLHPCASWLGLPPSEPIHTCHSNVQQAHKLADDRASHALARV